MAYPVKTLESLSVSLTRLSAFVEGLSEDGVVVLGRANRGAQAQEILHDLLRDEGGEIERRGVVTLIVVRGVLVPLWLHLGH